MRHTGSSCVDIYKNHPDTRTKSGYYRTSNNQWTYCNMTEIHNFTYIPTCAGVGGRWIKIIIAANGCYPGWYQGAHIHFDSNYCLNGAGEGCLSSIYNIYGITYTPRPIMTA